MPMLSNDLGISTPPIPMTTLPRLLLNLGVMRRRVRSQRCCSVSGVLSPESLYCLKLTDSLTKSN
jgi:hypothetical protein